MSLSADPRGWPRLRRILLAALFAGLAAGVVASLLQHLFLRELILQAESLEHAAHGAAHAAEAPGLERSLYTLGFNVLIGIGYGLILAAGLSLRPRAGLGESALWGLCGWASFSLSPALGLPPELPGSAAAALEARQTWWILAATSCAAGLALAVFSKLWWARLLGVALVALPHLVGAPAPPAAEPELAPGLAREFAWRSLACALVFWQGLGVAAGWLLRRPRSSVQASQP